MTSASVSEDVTDDVRGQFEAVLHFDAAAIRTPPFFWPAEKIILGVDNDQPAGLLNAFKRRRLQVRLFAVERLVVADFLKWIKLVRVNDVVGGKCFQPQIGEGGLDPEFRRPSRRILG